MQELDVGVVQFEDKLQHELDENPVLGLVTEVFKSRLEDVELRLKLYPAVLISLVLLELLQSNFNLGRKFFDHKLEPEQLLESLNQFLDVLFGDVLVLEFYVLIVVRIKAVALEVQEVFLAELDRIDAALNQILEGLGVVLNKVIEL